MQTVNILTPNRRFNQSFFFVSSLYFKNYAEKLYRLLRYFPLAKNIMLDRELKKTGENERKKNWTKKELHNFPHFSAEFSAKVFSLSEFLYQRTKTIESRIAHFHQIIFISASTSVGLLEHWFISFHFISFQIIPSNFTRWIYSDFYSYLFTKIFSWETKLT